LDEYSTVGHYYLDMAPAERFVGIKFVAVAESARGSGIGRRVVDDNATKFADRDLCTFSEEDELCRALGWTEHRRRKDTQHYRLLFTLPRCCGVGPRWRAALISPDSHGVS